MGNKIILKKESNNCRNAGLLGILAFLISLYHLYRNIAGNYVPGIVIAAVISVGTLWLAVVSFSAVKKNYGATMIPALLLAGSTIAQAVMFALEQKTLFALRYFSPVIILAAIFIVVYFFTITRTIKTKMPFALASIVLTFDLFINRFSPAFLGKGPNTGLFIAFAAFIMLAFAIDDRDVIYND